MAFWRSGHDYESMIYAEGLRVLEDYERLLLDTIGDAMEVV